MNTAHLLLLLVAAAAAYNNGMGRKPPLGWNSWCTDSLCNLVGKDPCSEDMVKTTADSMVSQGMVALGYKYVTLDDCWSSKTRDAVTGELQVEPKAFPNGMKAVADYVHSKGLYFGLYTSAGDKTCKGDRPGSYGHYETDARTLAGWGVDFIKMDHCGMTAAGNATDIDVYGQMSQALNATGRPILFSLCQWGEQRVYEWGSKLAQMYRVQMDHLPFWYLPSKSAGAGIGQGTVQIIEYMASLTPSKWTRSYGWMDPDFLMTLYPTMDEVASRTELSFWAIWSSPMLVATDVRKMSATKRKLLMNADVLAINQDDSDTAGDRLRNESSGAQLWARVLANGDKAILLFNSQNSARGPQLNVSCTWSELGWPNSAKVRVRDLWLNADLGVHVFGFTAPGLAPRDVRFLRLSIEGADT